MQRRRSVQSRFREAWLGASTERVLLLASLLLTVGIIVIGFFSPAGLSIFDDPGSAADWVAAIGTWVIGFGAIRLAAGDRELKLRERQEKRVEELNSELEEIQRVVRNADSARDALKEVQDSVRVEATRLSVLASVPESQFRHSEVFAGLQGALYKLSWSPIQLRLLKEMSPIAVGVDQHAEQISALSTRLAALENSDARSETISRFQGKMVEIRQGLGDLIAGASKLAESHEAAIAKLRRELDAGL